MKKRILMVISVFFLIKNDCLYYSDIDYTGIEEEQLPIAKILFETVASVLKRSARSAICSSANFYEIGGNSLNSICTVTKLNQAGFEIGGKPNY